MSQPATVVLYSTSVPAFPKVRADIATIKRILDAKRVAYEEVDLSMYPERREAMLAGSDNQRIIPQLHVNGQYIGTADDIQELEDFGQLDEQLRAQAGASS